jgi:hypothetical protein
MAEPLPEDQYAPRTLPPLLALVLLGRAHDPVLHDEPPVRVVRYELNGDD